MRFPKRTILFFVLFFFAVTGACAAGKGKSVINELAVDGSIRSYIVYVPAVADTTGLPLMIVLHGGLGNAEHMERMTGMDEVADSGHFIVAYPDGTGGFFPAMRDRRTWNAGSCCGRAARLDVDDVSFIEKMIDKIHARYSIDRSRVYVAGMSNGAMMAYRLACEIPERIAAIISVSGTLTVDDCDAAKKVPVLAIHGDNDRHVPFEGGVGEDSVSGVSYRSVPDTMRLITRARHCKAPEEKDLKGGISVFTYHCSEGAPVELYKIKGGRHVWPGGHGRNNTEADGRYISASRLAWDFARQFSKKH